MDFYRPLLANNQRILLATQFSGYTYNFIFPLSEEASWLQLLCQRLLLSLSLCCYVATLIGEFCFLYENIDNIPLMVDCLSTSCVGVQIFIRMFILKFLQGKLRALLEWFYREIYFNIEPTTKQQIVKTQLRNEIRLSTRSIDILTKFYYSTFIFFYTNFLLEVLNHKWTDNNKPYIYQMSFRWYDAQQPLAYVITSLYTGWLTWSCVSLMSAGDYLLATILCHTSFRYKVLRQELAELLNTALQQAAHDVEVPQIFRQKLHNIFSRQQQLKSFILQARAYFTYQIFLGVSFAVFQICLIMFQLQRTSVSVDWLKYMSWLLITIMQIVIIGYYGQMLQDETTGLQNSFYMCQWERVLPYGDARSNQLLMADIKFAILHTQTPVVFDGLKMFQLTHNTIGMALRSAMSYFMFLNTMNNATN